MRPPFAATLEPAVLLLAILFSLASASGADNAALQAEIEAFRKAALEQFKDRKPDNFEDYVRDTATRDYYQRQFNAALTNGNAVTLATVFKDYPEFGRAQFLNNSVMQGKSALQYAVEQGHRAVVELLLAQKVGADAPRPVQPSPFGGGPFGPPSMQLLPPGYMERRDTPLHAAVRAGKVDMAKLLLDAGANIEAMDSRQQSPLYTTLHLLGGTGSTYGIPAPGSEAHARQEEMLTLLLRKGAHVVSTNRFMADRQPLAAVVNARKEVLLDQLLTNCIHLAATNISGDTLAHLAVTQGRTNALKNLLEKLPPLAAVNAGGFTPLRSAAWLPVVAALPVPSYSGSVPHIEPITRAGFLRQQSANLLLTAGAEPDAHSLAGLNRTNELTALLRRDPALASALDGYGRSPLHYAVNAGSSEALQTLLKAGAQTEWRDKSGLTPLLLALTNRRFNEATNLLAAGAKVTATNATGQTVLHLAVGGDTSLCAALVKAGADLNARDASGKTPVELAAISQRFDLVKWLEEQGAVVSAKTERLMRTPLHQAAAEQHVPWFHKLLSEAAKTEVDARDELGRTPLYLAVGVGRTDFVAALLAKGANPNIPDTNGVTPLRARFFAALDLVPDPLPKPGYSKKPITSSSPKKLSNRAATLPPELRPTPTSGEPPIYHPLILLLENGANPKVVDAKGHTILHELQPVLQGQTPQLIQQQVARLRLLALYGLAPDTRSAAGLTALHLAAARADLIHTFALLELGAGVNATDKQGRTALHHILTPQMNPYRWQNEQEIRRDLPRTLALLLNNGADLRLADTNGATALHSLPAMDDALRDLLLPVLKTNRQFVAALRQKNKAGQTPVTLAFEQLRVKPIAPVAKMLTTLLESGGELPEVTKKNNRTLLHDLAGISVIGHPFFGPSQPDPAATEAVAKLAAKVMAKSVNVDLRNAKGETPLHIAARQQNTTFATALLARGANPNAQDQQGDTPLHLVLRSVGPGYQSYPVIPLLVSNKCDLGRRNLAGESPLRLEVFRQFYSSPLFLPPGATKGFIEAAQAGDLQSVEAYLKLDPTLATFTNPTNRPSALRMAALAGQVEVAERLRKAGAADPLSAAVFGWTNLLAAFVQETPGLGETNFSFGMPLLHLAASRGQTASVRVLLTDTVSLQMEDSMGHTALYHAGTNGNANLIALLTARGVKQSLFDAITLADTNVLEALLTADPARANQTNGSGSSALLFATDVGNPETVRRLLAHGADPNRPTQLPPGFSQEQFGVGTVPLHLAAWSNRTDLAELLGQAKTNVKATNDHGYTALHFAAIRGHRETIEWLLARGADVNAQAVVSNAARAFPSGISPMNQGWTPLHLAVRWGPPAVIEFLVAKGAKLEATDALGRTPADLIERHYDLMRSPWPPSPYRGPAPGGPVMEAFRDPARAQTIADVLKKLGVVIPTTRGPIFTNRGLPPGFPSPPQPPAAPPGVPPAPKK